MFGSLPFGAGLFGGVDCCCNVVPPTPAAGGGSAGVFRVSGPGVIEQEFRDEDDVALVISLLDL